MMESPYPCANPYWASTVCCFSVAQWTHGSDLAFPLMQGKEVLRDLPSHFFFFAVVRPRIAPLITSLGHYFKLAVHPNPTCVKSQEVPV